MIDRPYLLTTETVKKGEREFDLAQLAARSTWHAIFDDLSSLEQQVGDKSSQIVRDFREWCLEERRALDWKRHAAFYYWFSSSAYLNLVNASFLADSLAAIANALANEKTFCAGMTHFVVLHSESSYAYGAQRPLDIQSSVRVVKLSASAKLGLTIPNGFSWAGGRSWNIAKFEQV